MIKLIASDLDGTLLKRSESLVSEQTKTAVLSALASGKEFAVISGRDVPSLKRVFGFAADKVFYVGCNGAVCVKKDKVIYSRPVSDISVLKAFRYAKESDKNLVLCAADTVYVCGTQGFYSQVSPLYGEGETIAINNTSEIKKPIYKISFFTAYGEPKVDFSDFSVRLSYCKNGWTEYVSRFATKGGALTALQSHLGILKTSTASLGDSREDSEMFRHSAISFAFDKEAEEAFSEAISVKSFSEAYETIIKS